MNERLARRREEREKKKAQEEEERKRKEEEEEEAKNKAEDEANKKTEESKPAQDWPLPVSFTFFVCQNCANTTLKHIIFLYNTKKMISNELSVFFVCFFNCFVVVDFVVSSTRQQNVKNVNGHKSGLYS